MKLWNQRMGFPTPEQVTRMVAAEVKRLAEAEYQRTKAKAEIATERRDRLRDVYRRHIPAGGQKVDFGSVRKTVEDVAGETLAAWRRLSEIDELTLADSVTRADFDELEFLVTRSLGELTGIKNVISLAKRMA